MRSLASERRDILGHLLAEAGCFRFGVAQAECVSAEATDAYRKWIAEGRHGEMNYLERYDDVRHDPRMLLEGAKSVIVCAFPYYSPTSYGAGAVKIARYALGDDYHEVLRNRLSAVADFISTEWGERSRICVDTAPIQERYWARKSGIGFIGRNRQLIIPDAGSYFFLAEIVTTLELAPDAECTADCGDCGRCLRACPGGALSKEGLDARKCNSYLTIEYHGELPAGLRLGDRIYGCDICSEVCPHNARAVATTIGELMPREALLNLSREDIAAMTQEEFSAMFRHSAVKRTKMAGLKRNIKH